MGAALWTKKHYDEVAQMVQEMQLSRGNKRIVASTMSRIFLTHKTFKPEEFINKCLEGTDEA